MKDAWFDQKTIIIKTLNPTRGGEELNLSPHPPPSSLPPPTKTLYTKNGQGGKGGKGEGQKNLLMMTITAPLALNGEN